MRKGETPRDRVRHQETGLDKVRQGEIKGEIRSEAG